MQIGLQQPRGPPVVSQSQLQQPPQFPPGFEDEPQVEQGYEQPEWQQPLQMQKQPRRSRGGKGKQQQQQQQSDFTLDNSAEEFPPLGAAPKPRSSQAAAPGQSRSVASSGTQTAEAPRQSAAKKAGGWNVNASEFRMP
jgi:hypothetical protein